LKYLVDTNIISELRKGGRGDPGVQDWYQRVDPSSLFLSALTVGEIRKGIEIARRSDLQQAHALERWLRRLVTEFAGRILLIDAAIAEEWGHLAAVRSLPVIDGLLAATAQAYDLTLVTRNTRDLQDTGAQLLNPFET
jgi:predicted nucleic acid-binding protein